MSVLTYADDLARFSEIDKNVHEMLKICEKWTRENFMILSVKNLKYSFFETQTRVQKKRAHHLFSH